MTTQGQRPGACGKERPQTHKVPSAGKALSIVWFTVYVGGGALVLARSLTVSSDHVSWYMPLVMFSWIAGFFLGHAVVGKLYSYTLAPESEKKEPAQSGVGWPYVAAKASWLPNLVNGAAPHPWFAPVSTFLNVSWAVVPSTAALLGIDQTSRISTRKYDAESLLHAAFQMQAGAAREPWLDQGLRSVANLGTRLSLGMPSTGAFYGR